MKKRIAPQLVALAVLSGALTGCLTASPGMADVHVEQTLLPPSPNHGHGQLDIALGDPHAGRANTTKSSNVLDLETVAEGDQIGALTVRAIAPLIESRPLSEDNVAVAFTGTVTVTGDYYHSGGYGREANSIWFGPLEAESDQLLPRLPTDPSSFGFLVTNYNDIKDFFGPAESTGTATVTIDHYVLQRLAQSDAAAAWAEVTAIFAVDPDPPASEGPTG